LGKGGIGDGLAAGGRGDRPAGSHVSGVMDAGIPVSPAPVRLRVHLGPDDLAATLRGDVRAGLTARPKELPPKWLYDERGCELFDEITRLPEYYPTRAERSILEAHAEDIAAAADADTLIELGSGTSDKTRLLLDALVGRGALRRFVPFDVAESTLQAAAESIAAAYAPVVVEPVVGDFETHLAYLPGGGRRLIALLGGTIGNLAPVRRSRLLSGLATSMAPGDMFVLGTDLVKDRRRLVAAYDDSAGVTAAFNRNILSVLNRELGATFDPGLFDHVACFDEENSWIEMRLRSRVAQKVPVPALGIVASFEEGEEMRTEISAKFTTEQVRGELAAAGLQVVASWTDRAGDFALSLAVR